MLSWIPIVGPILQGLFSTVSSIYSTFKSTEVEQIKADVATAQVSAQIIHDTNDDIGIRISRDIICFPVAVWCGLATYDTIIARHYPEYMFVVEKFPASISYLPVVVLSFLLGNIGFNIWKRK